MFHFKVVVGKLVFLCLSFKSNHFTNPS